MISQTSLFLISILSLLALSQVPFSASLRQSMLIGNLGNAGPGYLIQSV